MPEVTIRSDDVRNLARAIRLHANSSVMRREMYKGLNSATKPIRAAMLGRIPEALPSGGGLAAQMQAKVSATTSAARGGVSLRFRGRGYDIRTLTGGHVRHPVWGGPAWVDQTAGVDPEAFTGEFERQRPTVLREVTRVMDGIARKVTNI